MGLYGIVFGLQQVIQLFLEEYICLLQLTFDHAEGIRVPSQLRAAETEHFLTG